MSSEERIRQIVRDELRLILDKGLMYTAPMPAPRKAEPPPQPKQQTPPPNIKRFIISPDLDAKLNYERRADNVLVARPKAPMADAEFRKVNEEIKALGGKYVRGEGWELP